MDKVRSSEPQATASKLYTQQQARGASDLLDRCTVLAQNVPRVATLHAALLLSMAALVTYF